MTRGRAAGQEQRGGEARSAWSTLGETEFRYPAGARGHYHQPASPPGEPLFPPSREDFAMRPLRLAPRLVVLAAVALVAAVSAAAADGQLLGLLRHLHRRQGSGSKGIYRCQFDAKTGKLSRAGTGGRGGNPSFLAVHPSRKFLYAVGEVVEAGGRTAAGRTPSRLDATTGKLTQLERGQVSGGGGPCHVPSTRPGTLATVANYGGGSTVVLQARRRTASSASRPGSSSTRASARTRAGRRSRTPTAARSTPAGTLLHDRGSRHRQGEGVPARPRDGRRGRRRGGGHRHAARLRPAAHRPRPGRQASPTSAANSTRP